MSTPHVLAIPVKLDAFVLNAAVCGGKDRHVDNNKDKAKIAPLSQPNYTFLRFERTMVQNDVLNFTDLHKTSPAPYNPRFTDLGTGETRTNRQGVYIHWIVPRPYRTGTSTSSAIEEIPEEDPQGPDISVGDASAPDFNPAPPRWLVIRKVEKCEPEGSLPEVDAWIVESDRRQVLDDIAPTTDLQLEISPYISGVDKNISNEQLEAQAEVFIGYKAPAKDWKETFDPNNPLDKQAPLRVDLNLVSSSNQLFPDYQPHNSNVFSIVDTLQYPNPDPKGDPLVVQTATLSYYLLGWHSSDAQDIFGHLDPAGDVTRGARLDALNMELNEADDTTKAGVKHWLESKDPTRIICHGAMYNILWDIDNKPPIVPADNYFEKLNKDMPVSVGTTPMDALLTYVRSHAGPNSEGNDDIKEVEQDLMRIQKLLHARDDGVDAQNEADDIVYNWNYASTAGGSHYFLATSDGGKGDKGQPTAPDPKYIQQLAVVNSQQQYLDSLSRQLQLRRWEMFSLWWQYMTDLSKPDPQKIKPLVKAKSDQIMTLLTQINNVDTQVKKNVSNLPPGLAQKGVLPSFYQGRDPTMLVAGIESGWPWDYLQKLRARVDTQLYVSSDAPPMDGAWSGFCTTVLPKLPDALHDVCKALVQEFLTLNPNLETTPAPQPGSLVPLYHDKDKTHLLPDGTAPWRDRWEQSQAWFPLFLEWEAEYTHVPYTLQEENDKPMWTLGPRSAWLSDPKKLRYGIAPGVELADLKIQDKRTVSGRVLILPQPNFNLNTIVTQILDNTPSKELQKYLTPDQQEELRNHLTDLAFLSSPLSGFTDHLLTQVQGNHVKPTVRVPNSDPVPFPAAVDVGKDVGFGSDQLTMIGIESDLTPYGTLVPYLAADFCPFKPVTHGQFRFTALNIIDKFGQAIHAIDPTPVPIDQGPPPLYPCISEYYTPQPSNKDPTIANTVVQDRSNLCQYVQLPPSINQPARLNATFVDYFAADPKTGAPAGWRPLTEWDNPVWGWVVPNYADLGFQLFLPDGTFFREVRLGGPSGATESGAWLPFQPPPPDTTKDPNVHQLQLFANQLANADYLHSFAAMLRASLNTTAPPPTAYGEFLSSLIGKPFALIKASYSLELATGPLSNTSTIDGPKKDPDLPLLPPGSDPNKCYSFALQLGDRDRVYDGLLAYFHQSVAPVPGNTLDLGTLYTHFIPDSSSGGPKTPNLTPITTSNYPIIKPFWVDPVSDDILKAKDQATAYQQAWIDNLQPHAIGAIVDPFIAMHAYSGILPTNALQLPAWTWQKALAKMTAFFHMGPLLVTKDVPGFVPSKALQDNYDLTSDKTLLESSGIGVPSMQAGEWAWLQAYSVDKNGKESGGEDAQTKFVALGMAAVDPRPRFEPAPYAAVEGYMQLRKPIGQVVEPAGGGPSA
ncbi:hypothetical protein BDZ91DRAFT_701295 [Kalaharituber pfeilii]|nr:hypothetical protein BDZ91DRAFT_701295 [Kalaharituber pfeilii]